MTQPHPARPLATSPLNRTAVTVLRELTERDLFILQVLHEHQVLTGDQIARLKFPSLDRAQQRLRQLSARGVLDRFRAGIRPGSQAWRYTLGLLGEAIIAAEQNRPAPRPAAHADRVLRLARSPRLDHLLGTNEFFIALAHHARQNPGSALRWWLNERRATDRCAGLARPDAFGTWIEQSPSTGKREVSFFVEFDTGTEPLQRLVDKLPGYAEARLGGGPDYPVLFWLPSPRREAHLQELLARRPSPVAVATATPQAGPTTDHAPAAAVWLTPGHTRRRLIDLAADVAGEREAA